MTRLEQSSYIFQATVDKRLPMVVDGKGMYITLEDPKTGERRQIIDAMTGAAVGALGHRDPEIIDAMKAAAEKTVYSFPAYFSNYPASDLAEFIIKSSPPNAFAAAVFVGSGSEANENALKIIRQYHVEKGEFKRKKFISRKQAYHGYTLAAMSIADYVHKDSFKDIMLPAENTPKVSQCYPYRLVKENETLEQYKDRLVKEVEDTIIAEGSDTVAAVIFETVGGSTIGTTTPIPGYLEGVKKVCEKYGVLFMLDEVMCGMGRCGTLHAWEQYMPLDNGPDIQTIGKTLGSGYVTIAGVLVSPKVKDVFVKGSGLILGAQTYHSHHFNCSVALAIQQKIAKDGLIANIAKNGNYLADKLKEKCADSPIVGDIRGSGSFWSIEFVKNKETKEPFAPELGVGYMINGICLKNGVHVMGMNGTIDGKAGSHILIAPAYTLTQEDADVIANRIAISVDEAAKTLLV
ncbi:PLP-dependent transferase [Nadsonia fulvescens var. elongata DSM 6958]|uniref:PLP-dependent transferase n=1 Tax=Nadsonia fulvescens var. elongata DSM 6958 TaxID=857566 RepID=A0A1E3PFE2_9ASCO|nr:PLP-dependent transferase [Nadsonia fulvescens var. elongata DSM 6958]